MSLSLPVNTDGLFGGAPGGPTVLRIALGAQLRQLRESAGVSREQAGDVIRASHAKISRLELGRVGLKEADIANLLTLYGVDDSAEREQFLEMVRKAHEPGWWQQYDELLPPWFAMFLHLEQLATRIRTFQVSYVPGLLQSEEYARRMISHGRRGVPVEEIEERVHVRMLRQKHLIEDGAPHLWAVVDEGALRRHLGPHAVLKAQLAHLLEMSELPNVALQVLPLHRSGLTAVTGPFTLLRFAEPDLPDVVYMEQLTSAVYREQRDEVEHYLTLMELATVEAASPLESRQLVHRLMREI